MTNEKKRGQTCEPSVCVYGDGRHVASRICRSIGNAFSASYCRLMRVDEVEAKHMEK